MKKSSKRYIYIGDLTSPIGNHVGCFLFPANLRESMVAMEAKGSIEMKIIVIVVVSS